MIELFFNNRFEFGGCLISVFYIFLLISKFAGAFYANSAVQIIQISNNKISNNSNIDDMNYYLDPDDDLSYPAMFPSDRSNIDCCGQNSSFCSDTFNDDCACDTSNLSMEQCRCSCPATIKAIDYTVRLAAGVAIVILVGVSITLAISLYRRAVSGYDNTAESGRRPSGGPISVITSTTTIGRPPIRDSPPRYDDIFVANESVPSDISYNKLPSYEEALRSSTSSESETLSTEIGKLEPTQVKVETAETTVVSYDNSQCNITAHNNGAEEPVVCGSVEMPTMNHVIIPNTISESSNDLNHSNC